MSVHFHYLWLLWRRLSSQTLFCTRAIFWFKKSGHHMSVSGALHCGSDTQPHSWQLHSEWVRMALQAVIVCPCNNTVRRPTPPGGAAEIRWRWRSSPSQTCSAWLSVETLSPVLDKWRGKHLTELFCRSWSEEGGILLGECCWFSGWISRVKEN